MCNRQQLTQYATGHEIIARDDTFHTTHRWGNDDKRACVCVCSFLFDGKRLIILDYKFALLHADEP